MLNCIRIILQSCMLIVTEIKPTILFHRSENGEKHNLIEQIATDKVKELIKISGSNTVDVEIHSVTLL